MTPGPQAPGIQMVLGRSLQAYFTNKPSLAEKWGAIVSLSSCLHCWGYDIRLESVKHGRILTPSSRLQL